MATWFMLVSLPLLLLVFAVHLATGSSDAAPSTSKTSWRPQTTVINGRLFYAHSLFPVDPGFYNAERDSDQRQAEMEAALDSVVPIKSVVDVSANYGYKSRSRQFAEELYAELWEGEINLLCNELYDLEHNALRAPHDFWDYLSQGAQPAVAFVHMLHTAEWNNNRDAALRMVFRRFAKLVSKKVPQTAYYIASYLGEISFPLGNISVDEWPQVLLYDPRSMYSIGSNFAATLHYYLMQSPLEHATDFVLRLPLSKGDWLCVLRTFCTVQPSLLRRYFDAGILGNLHTFGQRFAQAAPLAMSFDSTLSKYLKAMAKKFNFKEPVAESIDIGVELADNAQAGGNLHMQPLALVAQRADVTSGGWWYTVASSTRKTVAGLHGLRMHIAAGNVLCALPGVVPCYFHIRSFESEQVRAYNCAHGYSVQVKVQHGDVIAVHESKEHPSFLKAKVDCTGLSREECFERVKSFSYSARDASVSFLVIVESDGFVEGGRFEETAEGVDGKGEEQQAESETAIADDLDGLQES